MGPFSSKSGLAGKSFISLFFSIVCFWAWTQKGFAGMQDSLAVQYQKGLSTDYWSGVFKYERQFGPAMSLRVHEFASSSRLQVNPENDKWKDQHQLALTLTRQLNPKWKLQVSGDSRFFSDKQSGYMNDMRMNAIDCGITYQTQALLIPIGIGPKEDRRFNRSDKGMSMRLGVQVPRLELAGYTARLSSSFDADDLENRKNNDFNLNFGIHRLFEAGTADSLQYTINHLRRDYYITAAGLVESRNEHGQEVANILTYPINRHVQFRIFGSLYSRNLTIQNLENDRKEKQRERKDFRARGSLEVNYTSRTLSASLGLESTGEEQNYWLAKTTPSPSTFSGSSYSNTPDNRGRWTTLAFRVRWGFLPSDSMTMYSSLQKLQYDTPDPSNMDDRDELRFWIDVQESHAFSESLELRSVAAFHMLHQVFINGERSADNSRIRILRFNPEVRWVPSHRIRFSQAAEVMSNYVDYDFESIFPGIRSFAYRKYRLEDSVWVRIFPRTAVYATGRLELDENGKLLFDRWLEQRLIDRNSINWTISLDYQPMAGLHLMPGYTVYKRKGYIYPEALPSVNSIPQKELNLFFRNQGPTLKVVYSSMKLAFAMTLGTTLTRTLNAASQRLTRMDLNMNWRL